MFKSLKIKNFQSHKDTELNFVPGVNVLLGRGQSGKTAVIRALILALTNRPLGGRFFSDFAGGKGTAEVELELAEGNVINLKKHISLTKEGAKAVRSSSYRMDGKPYEGIGDKVPDLIESKLNMSDLNIHEQFDKPFLITSSPGEVAKVLNKVIRVEEADKWNSALTTQINTINNKIDLLKEELKGMEERLEDYADLPDMEKDVDRAERIQARFDGIVEKGKALGWLIDDLVGIKGAMAEKRRMADIGPLVDNALELQREKEGKQNEAMGLQSDLEKLGYIEEKTKALGKKVEVGPLVKEAEGLNRESKEKDSEFMHVGRLLDRVDVLTVKIKEVRRKADDFVREYGELLVDVGRCPTCFTRVDEKTIARIVKEI